MSLEAYEKLDLAKGGAIVGRLFERLDREVGSASLRLTGDGDAGALSANLSPAMNAWTTAEIAQTRASAINEIESEAAQITMGGGLHGIVPEFEGDKLKRHRNHRRAEVHANYYDKHRDEIDDLAIREHEYQGLKTERGGREPKNPGKLLDLAIPLGIMIPEGFMNYKYFFDYIQVGIIALGSTIVVGLGIGWSAYIAGRFWKAYHYYMRPDDDRQRQKGLRMLSIAMTLLSVSLMAVGAVRYFGVLRQVADMEALGQVPPNPLTQTGFLLFGNLLVFALGLAITFWLHDEDPHYAEKAEALDKQKKKVDALRKKDLVNVLDGIDMAFKQDSEKMQNKARLMNGAHGYDLVREKLRRLQAKDQQVVGLLQDYRGELCERFGKDKPIHLENGQAVSTAQCATLGIELYRC